MKLFSHIRKILHIQEIKSERELWQNENMKSEFDREFARSNSDSAKVLLPVASVIFAVIIALNFVFTESLLIAVLYSLMLALSVVSYIVIKLISRDIAKNSKKILVLLNSLACWFMILMSALAVTDERSSTSVILFAATVTIITQAMILRPAFSFFFVLGSMIIFGVLSIFDNELKEVDYHAVIGIIMISAISFLVSYSRYYNRCRVIYGKKVILSQNRRLDEMVEQLKSQKIELEHTNKNLETAYICDRLTGLYNRWYWDENVDKTAEECVEGKKNTAVIMIDLDNFKAINDENGHAMGDICLVHVANTLKSAAKNIPNCSVFRMGGEEFVVFCRDAQKGEVFKLANQILKDISNIKIDGFDGMLTASLGVHIEIPTDKKDIEAFLIKADNAMYEAKKQGKNRMVLSLH